MANSDDHPAHQGQTDRWLLLGLLLLAVLVRAPLVSRSPDALTDDVDDYLVLARNLHTYLVYQTYGDLTPTARRPPLYPLLLSALVFNGEVNPGAIAALHVALGLGTVLLVAAIGKSWELGRWRFLAGALVSCDPILLKQSTVVMTETLAAFLAALALWAMTGATIWPTARRAALAGAILGLTVLCRPTFLIWCFGSPIALWWLLPRAAHRARCVLAIYMAAAAVLAPWAVRNAIQFGRPIVTTTHGGFTLLLANNPEFYEHLRTAPREPWDATAFNEQVRISHLGTTIPTLTVDEPRRSFELSHDAEEYKLAWQNIRNEPAMFLRACVYRLSRLWGLMPLALPGQGARERQLRFATAAWYALEFGLAAVGVWSLSRRMLTTPWLFGLLLAASFTAVHALYWTDMRMRAPLMPAVALAAAAGGGWSYVRIARRNPSHDRQLQSNVRT